MPRTDEEVFAAAMKRLGVEAEVIKYGDLKSYRVLQSGNGAYVDFDFHADGSFITIDLEEGW